MMSMDSRTLLMVGIIATSVHHTSAMIERLSCAVSREASQDEVELLLRMARDAVNGLHYTLEAYCVPSGYEEETHFYWIFKYFRERIREAEGYLQALQNNPKEGEQ
jgi:hypothetical protein